MGKCISKSEKDDNANIKVNKETKTEDIVITDNFIKFSDTTKTDIPKTWIHLIVDDSKDNRYILKEYISKFGIECHEAINGKDALEKDLDKYDVIWMDLRMPVMDGIQCSTIIRKEKGLKTPIIAVTGDIAKDNIKTCNDIGIDYLIMKPIVFSEFMNCEYIKKYIEIKERDKEENE